MFGSERTSADAGGLFEIEGSSAVAAGGFVPGGGEATPIVVGVISPLWRSRPTAAVRSRPFRNLWLVGILIAVVAWSLPLSMRRSEVGLYLSLGLTRRQVALIRSVSGALDGVLVSVLAALGLMIMAGSIPGLRPAISQVALREVLVASVILPLGFAAMGAMSTVSGDPASLVKDR